jgi:hypothetical protein
LLRCGRLSWSDWSFAAGGEQRIESGRAQAEGGQLDEVTPGEFFHA